MFERMKPQLALKCPNKWVAMHGEEVKRVGDSEPDVAQWIACTSSDCYLFFTGEERIESS
jgi:hypothetical protein